MNEPTTLTLDGDYSQKAEVGRLVLSHHTGHSHLSYRIAGQSATQKAGPLTLSESFAGGAASASASLTLPFGSLPLGHFDLSKAGTHKIDARLDGGNWFRGTLTVE